MNTRPLTLILAIVLLVLLSVFGLITPFGPNGGPPLPIALFGFIVDGIGGLIAVFGLWRMQHWGLLLTLGIAALTILVAVPGLWFAPTLPGKLVSVVLIVVNALLLVLATLPTTRKAVSAARAPMVQA